MHAKNTLILSAILSTLPFISYAEHRNDITLNPLPSSTRIAPEDFTLKEIAHFPTQDFVSYHGIGDTDLDGNPEVFISGWKFSFPDPETPPKVPFYMFEANPDETESLSTEVLFGRSDTDGTAFLRVDDYDLDGLPDVLIVGHNESPFVPTENILYKNNGASFDAHPFDYKLAMHEGSTGDFNNDGYPDFIGSAYRADIDTTNYPAFLGEGANSNVVLYINDTVGSFTPYILKFNKSVEGGWDDDIKWIASGSDAVFGNIDDDPEMEIIIVDHADSPTDSSYGSMSLIIDNIEFESKHIYGDVIALPDTYFRTRPQFADNPTKFPGLLTHAIQVDLMDVDNDGDNDILVNTMIWTNDAYDSAGVIQILRNDGERQFTDITDDALFNYNLGNVASHEMRIIDINDDGFLDLIGAEEGNNDNFEHTWGVEYPYQGTMSRTTDKGWANEVLINTGNGKFVSSFWEGFHQLTLQQEAIYQSYVSEGEQYALSDKHYYPYMLADGRLGFVTFGHMYLNNENTMFYFDVRANDKFYTGPKGAQTENAIGYSEYYYLTENPEVVTAINAGTYADGLAHYLAKGKVEGKFIFAKNAKIHGTVSNDSIVLREGDEKATRRHLVMLVMTTLMAS
ncbi:MAG: VCBS repeat-containing protein [Paraglaciecola sp.]|uniref:FG-GAP repeat domain-containing protein n=1 Tax=Paraglaciecola sp. TaxID=1920173 RepID=UPI003296C8DD